MARVKKVRPLWQKLILSLVSTLVFLLFIEVLSAFLFKTGIIIPLDWKKNLSLIYDYDMLYYNEPSRTALGNFKDVRPCRYTTNSFGFREDSEIAEIKPEDEYRIFCVGDSSTFGITVDQVQTYPAQLQSILNERSSGTERYRVINGGCAGFTSFQAVRFMERWVKKLKPDLIIYSIGFNDSTLARDEDKDVDYHKNVFAWLQRAFYSSNTFVLINQLTIINVMLAGKKKRAEPTCIRVRLSDYGSNLKRSVQIAREYGAMIIFCPITVVPQYMGVMHKVAAEYNVPIVETEESLWRAFNAIWNGAEDYGGQKLDYRGEIEISFTNFAEMGELKSSTMRTKPYVFDDTIHPNPIGYRAIAEDLAKRVP